MTKFHPASLVRELVAIGAREFGESRLQEAAPKAAALREAQEPLDGLPLRWHFIGQLQSRKARAVLEFAGVVHSLDRDSLVDAIAAAASPEDPVEAFIQVNLTDDPARGGVRPDNLPPLAERALGVPGIRLAGLMAVAGLGAEPTAEFARLRELRDRLLLPIAPSATGLSMGMSADFPAAIREGATHLRIGTAITGIRQDPAYARNRSERTVSAKE